MSVDRPLHDATREGYADDLPGALTVRYAENPKHKVGARSGHPPRWFPSAASRCPDDLRSEDCQRLLDEAVDGISLAHPQSKAKFAVDDQGRYFKGYSEDHGQSWHGYEVDETNVKFEVPAKVLRRFRETGRITNAQYKRLLGSA